MLVIHKQIISGFYHEIMKQKATNIFKDALQQRCSVEHQIQHRSSHWLG